ncbi:MAG: histidinol phosphate phosphatase domain-containing protein [Deltaproteobacteria bacterium]|nr:histidinol phosphate phosphatase domain-containing protein [Deltaproteobacteria bacterium]
MIDLHAHTIYSDGELIPAELVRRAQSIGVKAIALTDHDDGSNMNFIIPKIIAIAAELNDILKNIKVIPGIEITHVPPQIIKNKVQNAKKLGAKIVIVHGETIAEPVAPGTNRAAIEAGADILAHPGLITEQETLLAKEKNVMLEITARAGHSLTNGHVARLAKKIGAKIVINTDTHSPNNLINKETAKKIVCGAGLDEQDFKTMQKNARNLIL